MDAPADRPRRPRPSLFNLDVFTYEELPGTQVSVSIGLHAVVVPTEWEGCTAVVMLTIPGTPDVFLDESISSSEGILDFLPVLAELRERHPSASWALYESPQQRGLGRLLRAHPAGVPCLEVVECGPPDPLVRALPYVEAWNAGLVRVPAAKRFINPERGARGLSRFLDQHAGFGRTQDMAQVLAAMTAYDLARGTHVCIR